MIGSRIPNAKRLINSIPPLDPNDLSEANALNIMLLLDNIGTGEYLEDMAILQRHLSQLAGHEQNTPNLTVRVEPGTAWYGLNSYVTFAGGNSPSMPAPAANPRRDIVVLRDDGNLYIKTGAEAAVPVAPVISSTEVAICQVYCRVGMVRIRDNDTQEAGQGYIEYDLRPLFQRPLGSDAMPKIGLVDRETLTTAPPNNTDSGYLDIVNYSGFGRINSIHLSSSAGGGTGTIYLRVIVDGTTFLAWSLTVDTAERDVMKAATNLSSELAMVVQTATPANDNPKGVDLFHFKSSIVIQHRANIGATGPSITTTVDWEHE